MTDLIISGDRSNDDLNPIFAGNQKCAPSHSFGPFIRDHTIVHFVLSGKGKLIDKFGEHTIGAGELFIIRSGEETTYTADATEPWHYTWIAFVGNGESIYQSDASVYKSPVGLGRELTELVLSGITSRDAYSAILYSLTYKLFTANEPPRDRLSEIKRHIEYHYMDKISVGELSKAYGYERTYLYRSFAARYGVGVKEYLNEIRMMRAREFLSAGRTVQETAFLVGFRDEFGFSRAFKKRLGVPPSTFRKK